ncbi:MAG: DoxX family protein [Caulobacteraceae bacterium]
MPELVRALVGNLYFLTLSRIVLTTLFWSAGLFGLFNFRAIVGEMASVSLPSPVFFAAATICVQLAGSVLVITNWRHCGWVGAGALGVFTLLTIPYGHAFWTRPEPRRTEEFHLVLEHVTVVGGLLLAAVLSAR